ncbi:DUF6279 family lipoprotein [Catenovulum sp. 2E275]|uniref:DUF6279 family lipoprotein n=1 Tax=Catenovulum sp. 2E275 TaxID=2980497 RepID=UPI0021D3D2A1|nr:DUF6279 family lipoprotein [Catenovulum sp. 2E275]MCU4675077.1 DUF6279 family lipoprotein [Catenovulum sp. 2E275]
MKRICWLILCWPLLTGCSLSFYYNKLDWFAKWYLDDYVELHSQQAEIFEQHFERWHNWHRQTQLPLYQQLLTEIEADIKQGISAEDVTQHSNAARLHWHNLLAHIAPDVTRQLLTLSAAQKQSLIENLKQNIEEKYQKFADKTDAERREDAQEHHIEDYENWFGRLTDKQIAELKQQLLRYQADRTLWFEYRLAYIKQFESLLFANDDPVQTVKLNNLLAQPEQMRSAALQQTLKYNQALYAEFLPRFIAGCSDKQKQHLLEKIADYKTELAELVR